jgi:type I restriction enzyme S subunit
MGLIPDPEIVDGDYLFHWIKFQDIYEFSNKANPPSITQVTVTGWPIPLPPLEEQRRIVAKLDQAFTALDRARAHAETNLADAGELFQAFKASLMDHPEGDTREVNLAEVTSIESKLVDPREPSYLDLPHLGAGNMITGSDELVDIQTAREEKLKSGKHPFDAQSVLYSKIRPYLMKVARPDFDGLCSADVYPLTPSANMDRNYLFHLLLSPDFTEYAVSGSDRAGMPKVNRNHLFAYTFDLPDIDVQRDIAARIDAAMKLRESLKDEIERKLADLAELRQSLLQKAFSGRLT